jgi:hypothetical protein
MDLGKNEKKKRQIYLFFSIGIEFPKSDSESTKSMDLGKNERKKRQIYLFFLHWDRISKM